MGRPTVSQFLITIDDALRALAEARTPEQLIGLANVAESLRLYAQSARLGMAARIDAPKFAFARKGSSANILWVRHAIRVAVLNLFRWGTGFPPSTISA